MCYALPEMKVRKYVAKILIHWTLHQTLTISEQECPECSGPIVGRNFLVESIAAVVFSRELSMSNRYTDNDEPENDGDDNYDNDVHDADDVCHGGASLLPHFVVDYLSN